jgi:transcriptional regulator with XRE-family HTH domain
VVGKDLKLLRVDLELSQGDLARFLGVSPRTMHTLENTRQEIPGKYSDAVQRSLLVKYDGLSFSSKSLLISDEYCWPANAYEQLIGALGKRARQIECRIEITPNAAEGDLFADVDYRVTYRGIELDEGKAIVMDHIGNPSGIGGRPARPEFVGPLPGGPVSELEIDKGAGPLGSYSIAYRIGPIKRSSRVRDVSIHLACPGGARRASGDPRDGVGFPVYADLLVDSLIVSVDFQGLVPEDPQPGAALLRRTACRFGLGTSSLVDCKPAIYGTRYVYGIIRPRGGMYFGLSWKRLAVPDTRGGRNHAEIPID